MSDWIAELAVFVETAGEKVADEGEGGNQVAQYLVAQKLI